MISYSAAAVWRMVDGGNDADIGLLTLPAFSARLTYVHIYFLFGMDIPLLNKPLDVHVLFTRVKL